jgi:RNA recognition motif. (a.k.a. RRM, RBD, or RNP domain)
VVCHDSSSWIRWCIVSRHPLAQNLKGCCPVLQLLYDTFNAFGVIVQTPKIMRDPETGLSRGFGFVSYDSFEASDASIEAMNGQFLCNR